MKSDTFNHSVPKWTYYLKYISFSICIAQFICGVLVIGVGCWLYISENIWMRDLDKRYVYQGSVLIISGSVVWVIGSLFGAIASVKRWRWLLNVFIFFQLIVFAVMVAAGIVGVVAQGYFPEELRGLMRNMITYSYGVNLNDRYNDDVTRAWDRLQSSQECCAVEDSTFSLYKASEWYRQQDGIIPDGDSGGDTSNFIRPYVPHTCCVHDFSTNSYDDLVKCQTWLRGPPAKISGEVNTSLHNKGCYNVVLKLHHKKAEAIVGIGFVMSLSTIPGSVVALILYFKLGKLKHQSKYEDSRS